MTPSDRKALWLAAGAALAWAGAQPAEDALVLARAAGLAYAAFFALVPLLARAETRLTTCR